MTHRKLHALAHRIAHGIEHAWDGTRFAVRRRTGLLGTPLVLPYRGFGTGEGVWVRGRVVENNGAVSAPHSDSLLKNIWLTLKRYETDEIRGATLSWRGLGRSGTVTTDQEGYFDFHIERPTLEPDAPWGAVAVTLEEAEGYEVRPLDAQVPVRIVSDKARFGVISDIDDTIVETGAMNFLKHWRTVVANSAESRTAFPGVSEFYRALGRGEAGPETNPFFYVSSGPWNLFDLFESFMMLHDIPLGPILLKDYGLDAAKWLTGGHEDHKLQMIERIMERYPHLSFVLVGDSGQSDAAIYAEAARRFGTRILAVHIRDVTPEGAHGAVGEALEALRRAGVPVTDSPTMIEPARLAAELGLVSAGTAERVAQRIREREASASEAARPA